MESSAIALFWNPGLTRLSTCPIVFSGSAMSVLDEMVMDEIETQMRQAASLSSSGALARKGGDEAAGDGYFREAFGLMLEVANRTANGEQNPARLDVLRTAALLALDCGDVEESRRLIDEAFDCDSSTAFSDDWAQLRDEAVWSDAWLIAAVRRDPPDVAAPMRWQIVTGNRCLAAVRC